MLYIAHVIAWLSTAAATISVTYITHSPWCLWAFAFPFLMWCENSRGDDSEKQEINKVKEYSKTDNLED